MKRFIFLPLLLIASVCFAGPEQMMLAAKLGNTISLTTPNNMAVGNADQTITCTTSSGDACTVTSNTASYCTIVAGKLHAVAAGTCTISANDGPVGKYLIASTATSGNVTISGSATLLVGDNATKSGSTESLPASSAYTCGEATNNTDYTAAATGTLNNGYLQIGTGGSAASFKMAVYHLTGGTTYTLVETSAAVTITANAVNHVTFAGTHTITSGQHYILVIYPDTGVIAVPRGTVTYAQLDWNSGTYASPAATLDASVGNNNSFADYQAYVTN